MPASSRPFVAPARERGAIAILAAIMMVALFVVALTEFSVAGLSIERRKTQNAVDAAALQLGNEMILNKNTSWQQITPATTYLLSHNGQDGSKFASPTLQPPTWFYGFNNDPTSASSPSLSDRWIPATVQVTATVSPTTIFEQTLQAFNNLVPGGASTGNPRYLVDAKAQVQQVQLSSFTVSRARAMLLFDFSPSMRLQYAGTTPGDWYASGIWAEKQSALQMIGYMVQQYNFSVRVFGYENRTLATAMLYNTNSQNNPQFSDAEQYAADSFGKLLSQDSLGDPQNNGTDMISSIQSAVDELYANNDYLAGAPILILVSDGEPDQLPGVKCTQSLQSCNAAAAAATQAEINSTWSINNLKGMPVETFTYLINRDNTNLKDQDISFMQSVAGNGTNPHNANNYVLDQDSGNADYITKFMLSLPIKDYCMSADISQLAGGKPADMAYPMPNEPISGFFTLGDVDPANQDMYQATQVFTWADLFADLDDYPRVAPIAEDPTKPYAVTPHLQDVLRQEYSKLARFYYDAPTRRVWLNPWLCFYATYFQSDSPPNPSRFRMRWGHPTLIKNPDDLLSQH